MNQPVKIELDIMNDMVSIANHLDSKGFSDEADRVDNMLVSFAQQQAGVRAADPVRNLVGAVSQLGSVTVYYDFASGSQIYPAQYQKSNPFHRKFLVSSSSFYYEKDGAYRYKKDGRDKVSPYKNILSEDGSIDKSKCGETINKVFISKISDTDRKRRDKDTSAIRGTTVIGFLGKGNTLMRLYSEKEVKKSGRKYFLSDGKDTLSMLSEVNSNYVLSQDIETVLSYEDHMRIKTCSQSKDVTVKEQTVTTERSEGEGGAQFLGAQIDQAYVLSKSKRVIVFNQEKDLFEKKIAFGITKSEQINKEEEMPILKDLRLMAKGQNPETFKESNIKIISKPCVMLERFASAYKGKIKICQIPSVSWYKNNRSKDGKTYSYSDMLTKEYLEKNPNLKNSQIDVYAEILPFKFTGGNADTSKIHLHIRKEDSGKVITKGSIEIDVSGNGYTVVSGDKTHFDPKDYLNADNYMYDDVVKFINKLKECVQ